jgi:kynurenine formamidase
VKLLGLEQPSVHAERHLEVHKALLSAGIVLIETLANFEALTQDRVYLVALPLRLAGADGAPARVIAIEGEL